MSSGAHDSSRSSALCSMPTIRELRDTMTWTRLCGFVPPSPTLERIQSATLSVIDCTRSARLGSPGGTSRAQADEPMRAHALSCASSQTSRVKSSSSQVKSSRAG
jgi:hypothetical protein